MARQVVVIGGGVGGLVAALELACAGLDVTLLERAATPGGKLRQVAVAGQRLDAGPTVFTMRWVFESIFADAGAVLSDHLSLRPASVLARHAWTADQSLDLFADLEQSADAIGRFAGAAEAAGFRAFSAEAQRIYATLEKPFIRGARPSMGSLVRDAGAVALWGIRPFDTLWKALSQHFRDPRLRQLFGRYATYCGSSPFLAPATLMLVAGPKAWADEALPGRYNLARGSLKLTQQYFRTTRFLLKELAQDSAKRKTGKQIFEFHPQLH